jgi:DNA-binding HxlR family transcriptional regulator/putative sterol carrier protein
MASRRTYADACGIARALDLVGERWALMIVRELLLGPKRFTDIRAGLPHLSADVLAQRLRELEEAGLVSHHRLPPPAASQVYELTSRGRALEPVLTELGRWGGAFAPPPPDGCGMSLDAHILSMRTLFDPELAGDLDARFELRLGGCTFHAEVAGGRFEIDRDRGGAPAPDATIATDPPTLIAVLHGHRPLADALRAGDLTIDGDRAAAKRFLRLFPLPAAAAA